MLWCVLLLAQDFSFAPPDAAFLASLNVRQVRGIAEEWAREAGVKSPVSWKVLDRVERVQVAIAIREGEPRMIAMLEGRFLASDVVELKKSATGPQSMKVEMLDQRRILISDNGMLKGFTGRRVAKIAAPPLIDTRPKVAVIHGMDEGPKEILVQ